MFDAAELEQIRTITATSFTDTVSIARDGAPTRDEFETETTPTVDVWAGAGLVQRRVTTARSDATTAAERPVEVVDYVAKLPIDCPVEVGDWLTVTASLDPRLIGRRFMVLEAPAQGWAVQRRVTLDPDD